MIVSFHPCFVADYNLICAGRDPGPEDLAAIRAADAVVLPQGCRRSLYEAAKRNCRRVFPNYDARFDYPGKTGQIKLFRKTGTTHPETLLFASTEECLRVFGSQPAPAFPLVFKFDWGGEGQGVFRFEAEGPFRRFLSESRFAPAEPCLVQSYIPGARRTLRVAVIGRMIRSYWRLAGDPEGFYANLSRGGTIDEASDPGLQAAGREAVCDFCKKTGIDLAGIDLLFRETEGAPAPLFLEVNYFFGRRGLGGSHRYYGLLEEQVRAWLNEAG